MIASASSPSQQRPPTLIGVGGLAWSGDPAVVYSTLLGSCVAVCLFDPVAGKGGLNHFLLANAPQAEDSDTRYGAISMPLLVKNLCAVGCRKDRLKAVVAGGADILSNIHPIGTENSTFAIRWLRSQSIEIKGTNYGGALARRVRFCPSTGDCHITTVDAPPIRPAVNSRATAIG